MPEREKDLQESTRLILDALFMTGEIREFYHVRNARGSRPGFPDWTVCIRTEAGIPLVVWIELKTAKGKLTEPQERWGECLGVRFHVARTLDEFADVLRSYDVPVQLS